MRRFSSVLVPLAIALSFVACRDERKAPSTTTAPAEVSVLPEAGGTVVRRLPGDLNTFNPLFVTSDVEKQVLSYLHDALVDIDKHARLVPGLAESWDVSPDGKIYTFKLAEGVRFSDGTPLTAHDVAFTIEKIADPKSQSLLGGLFDGIDLHQLKAVDDRTVQVVFTTPLVSRLASFNIPVLPKKHYENGEIGKDFDQVAIGTGPYRLVRHDRGKELVLQRRPDYWRRDKPFLETVVFKIIADENVAWNAMKRGDIDESLVSSDQWRFEGNSPAVQKVMEIHRFYSFAYNFIPWNSRDPLFADKRVRRAMSMCLDRGTIITNLYHGTARVISGPFPPDHWAYNPDVKAVEFDPEGAKKLLAEAGWRDSDGDGVLDRDGKRFEFEMLITIGNASSEQVAQIFQSSLKAAGVVMNIRKVDSATLFEKIPSGEFQAAHLGWSLDLDPDPYSYFHSSQVPPNGLNFVFMNNPRVDALIEQGRSTFDQDARQDIYHELHALLADEQPYTFTVQVSTKWAVNRRVKGVEIGRGLGLFLWHPGPLQWWIPQQLRTRGAAPPAN